MHLARTVDELAGHADAVLVPTMGALHEGHLSLVRLAVSEAEAKGANGAVVSIFVNPTQFNEASDYERYPRVEAEDVEKCRAAGATCVFIPEREVVYPAGGSVVVPPLPDVATQPGLEDTARPGHFEGVCQVVRRLFDLVRPKAAVFGEKDWQQLCVVRAIAGDIEIVPGPTVREAGGMAMSSRNRFLSPDERARGLAVSRALCEAREETSVEAGIERLNSVLRDAGFADTPDASDAIEYATIRDAETLMPPTEASQRPFRSLIAVRVGGPEGTRLIDNAPWVPAT